LGHHYVDQLKRFQNTLPAEGWLKLDSMRDCGRREAALRLYIKSAHTSVSRSQQLRMARATSSRLTLLPLLLVMVVEMEMETVPRLAARMLVGLLLRHSAR
jgi:hypothetical protein